MSAFVGRHPRTRLSARGPVPAIGITSLGTTACGPVADCPVCVEEHPEAADPRQVARKMIPRTSPSDVISGRIGWKATTGARRCSVGGHRYAFRDCAASGHCNRRYNRGFGVDFMQRRWRIRRQRHRTTNGVSVGKPHFDTNTSAGRRDLQRCGHRINVFDCVSRYQRERGSR